MFQASLSILLFRKFVRSAVGCLVVATFAVVASCGFQLRAPIDRSFVYDIHIRVDSPVAELQFALTGQLSKVGFTVIDSGEDYSLIIQDETVEFDELTPDDENTISSKILVYRVRYSVMQRDGSSLLSATEFRSQSRIRKSPSTALVDRAATEAATRNFRTVAVREIAQRLIRTLSEQPVSVN